MPFVLSYLILLPLYLTLSSFFYFLSLALGFTLLCLMQFTVPLSFTSFSHCIFLSIIHLSHFHLHFLSVSDSVASISPVIGHIFLSFLPLSPPLSLSSLLRYFTSVSCFFFALFDLSSSLLHHLLLFSCLLTPQV